MSGSRILSGLLSLALILTYFVPLSFASDPGQLRFEGNTLMWDYKVFGDETDLKVEVPDGYVLGNPSYDENLCLLKEQTDTIFSILCTWDELSVKDLEFGIDLGLSKLVDLNAEVNWSFDSKNYASDEGTLPFTYVAADDELEKLSEGSGDSDENLEMLDEDVKSVTILENKMIRFIGVFLIVLILSWMIFFRKP